MAVTTEKCENCGRVIGNLETPNVHDGHVVCVECKQRLSAPPAKAGNTPTKQARASVPSCQACGGVMKKDKRSHGNLIGIVLALIVFCIGVAIFVMIPCFGWVIGPIICILALFMGGKREKIWKCTSCSAFIPRA